VYVVVGHRAVCCRVYVVVGHRAILFVAGFGNLPVQGRCCRNLDLTLIMFLLLQERLLQRSRLVTLQDNKVRHKRPFFPYHVRISRNLARRLPFERDTVENMQIFAYL